jgi:hypothetical protein
MNAAHMLIGAVIVLGTVAIFLAAVAVYRRTRP